MSFYPYEKKLIINVILLYVCIKMSSMILYAKSKKFDHVGYTMLNISGGGHWCSAGYRSKGTEFVYTKDDAQAKTLLEKLSPSLSIVDLSQCDFSTKMRAILTGLRTTPTLVVDGEKYKGLENIKRFLNETLPCLKLKRFVNKQIKIGFNKTVQFGYAIGREEGVLVHPPIEDKGWFYVGKDKENYSIVYLSDVGLIMDENGNELYRRIT